MSPKRNKGDRDVSGDGETESFAELMGDARRIDPGPQRVAAPSSLIPPAARLLGNRRDAENEKARTSRFRWPDPDDSSRAAAEGVSDTTLFALGRGEPEPEERIDLHGTRRDAASRLVAKRLESARSRGLRCVLIVHGHGHGHGKISGGVETVLKQAIPGWLSKRPCAASVLAFAPAPRKFGGEGATMVLLRRQDSADGR